ncbi:unnamed protein product [Knipowitschia caucasica]
MSFSRAQCSVLFWAFLQADCGNCPQDYCEELRSLKKSTKTSLYHSFYGDYETDCDLEADGLSPSIRISLEDLEPSADVHVPENIQQVAAEIREIAAQFEPNIVNRATLSLTRNIMGSSIEHWNGYIHQEVQHVLRHGVALANLRSELVVAALTFTLVKRVCLQAPTLLRSLFDTTLRYLNSEGAR